MNSIILIETLIFILLIIIFMHFISNYINKNKTKNEVEKNKDSLNDLVIKKEKIDNEINRCEKISKNEDTKKLFLTWKKEYDQINKIIDDIYEIDLDLNDLFEEKRFKKYKKNSILFRENMDSIFETMNVFYEKLKNYTKFEIDNTQMAINLKERLKEMNNIFDQKLRVLDVYNNTFFEISSDINMKISEFEDKQIIGEYPKARNYLKSGNEILETLENKIKKILDIHQSLNGIEKELNSLNSIKNNVYNYKYNNFSEEISYKYNDFLNKKALVEDNLKTINLNDESTEEQEDNLISLFNELQEYCENINQKYLIINKIEEIKESNLKSIELIQELLDGALEEKNTIIKLYSVKDLSQIKNLEEEIEKFKIFESDYEILLDIIFKENDEFEELSSRINQSKEYLSRVLNNVKNSVKALAAIRSDEIEIRDKVTEYFEELIRINVYLREQNHYDRMRVSLLSIFKEIDMKIKELQSELEKEPLNITLVRTQNNIINKLLENFIVEIQKDIKQKKGVEKLAVYFNKFIVQDENYNLSKQFIGFYNDGEYRKILKEIYIVLTANNPKGEMLYKNVVNAIEIEEYKR